MHTQPVASAAPVCRESSMQTCMIYATVQWIDVMSLSQDTFFSNDDSKHRKRC